MKRLTVFVLLIVPLHLAADVLKKDYLGFTIWLDCDKRAAVKFEYQVVKDVGVDCRHY